MESVGGGLMTHAGLTRTYEVAMGPAALRVILKMPGACREKVAKALRTELLDGPNAGKEALYTADLRLCPPGMKMRGVIYTATPLSTDGYTAVHRPMTKEEIKKLRREHGQAASLGFYVFDILPATAAFTRTVPSDLA